MISVRKLKSRQRFCWHITDHVKLKLYELNVLVYHSQARGQTDRQTESVVAWRHKSSCCRQKTLNMFLSFVPVFKQLMKNCDKQKTLSLTHTHTHRCVQMFLIDSNYHFISLLNLS